MYPGAEHTPARHRRELPRPRPPGRLDAPPLHLVEFVDNVPALPVLTYARETPEPLAVVAVAGRERDRPHVVWANAAFADLFGVRQSDLVELDLRTLQSDEPLGHDATWSERVSFDATSRVERRCTLVRLDESRFPARVATMPVGSVDVPLWAVTVREEAEALRVDEHLRASEDRFRALADDAPVGIFASEAGLRLAYVNNRFANVLGATPEELLGTGWLERVHPEDLGTLVDAVEQVLRGEPAELRLRAAPPRTAWAQLRMVPTNTNTAAASFVGTAEDVTERLQWEKTLRHQANHDQLTGLPNRSALLRAISEAVEEDAARGRRVALLFFDLDDFKLVNDSLGHDAGDELLCHVAERLEASRREGDLVARFGGDEFVVLCRDLRNEDQALGVARRLLESVSGPAQVAGMVASVCASVGVVLADGSHHSADLLLRDADVAMYQAKKAGRNRAVLFDRVARETQNDRLQLLTDLRLAIDAELLHLAYQPVVAVADGSVVGVEALLRWDHPDRGPVPPAVFIPLAEQNGLIGRLGELVVREACRQTRTWLDVLGPAAPATVAINISAMQLHENRLVPHVRNVLADTGVPGDRICFELTESAIMEDTTAAGRTLHDLRNLGARLAIDDFGTGYSSLAYLRSLAVDHLKIDKSFISGTESDSDDPIVAAVIGLGRSLGLSAIAEGVETVQQREWLRRLGCDYAQGFYFSRPQTGEQTTQLLRDAKSHGLPLSPKGET